MISRREFALLAAGLAAPGRVLGKRRRRSSGASERKFLFLFNDGGWDTGYAFTDFSTVVGAGLEDGAEPPRDLVLVACDGATQREIGLVDNDVRDGMVRWPGAT